MPKSQQSWVRSQHPPTQWNLGAADEAVLNTVHEKNPPVILFVVMAVLAQGQVKANGML